MLLHFLQRGEVCLGGYWRFGQEKALCRVVPPLGGLEYGGSGPAQLALAVLAHHLGDDAEALELYQEFKRLVVAGFEFNGWTLTGADIDQVLQVIERSR